VFWLEEIKSLALLGGRCVIWGNGMRKNLGGYSDNGKR
jgi:hypothetical protein